MQSVELGLKFRADVNGFVTAARFYKRTTQTGTHVATLWTNTGTPLASVTFVNETASGWQTQAFSSPVPITAGTLYVISYHAPNGQYSVTLNTFASQLDVGPLHAPAAGTVGGNGVFTYSPSVPSFPLTPTTGTNYWVDIVFTT